MDKLRALWKLFAQTPDDFAGKPYEGALNQLGHWTLGVIFTALVCVGWFWWFGEMPDKIAASGGVILAYLLGIELAIQGWQGRDTLADTYFLSAGSIAVTWSLSEVIGPGCILALNEGAVFASFGLLVVPLIIYAWRRI